VKRTASKNHESTRIHTNRYQSEFKLALYGFRTAHTHGRHYRTFWSAAATLTSASTEVRGICVTKVLPWATCPPPLWIRRCIRSKPRHCGQGKAPSPRRVGNPAPRFPANATGIGSTWPRRFAGALQNSPESIKSLQVLSGDYADLRG